MAESAHPDELPLPDLDRLPVDSVERSIRAFDAEDLDALVRHERTHRDRHPVLMALERRLTALWARAES